MRPLIVALGLLAACGGVDDQACYVIVDVIGPSADIDCFPCGGAIVDGMCVDGGEMMECRAADRCDNVHE